MSVKKKILLAFDGSRYSEMALNFAIGLCKENGNQLTGIFVEDLSYLYMLTNIGSEPQAYEYPAALINDIEKEDMKVIGQSISAFKNKCSDAGINFNVHLDKGVPAGELIKESIYADLLLIGYQVYFSNMNERSNETLKDFLEGAHCPVWVVPESMHDIKEIIFTADDKGSSAWAIKQFMQIFGDVFKNKKATLLSARNNAGAEPENELLILDYLRLNFPDIRLEVRIGKAEEEIPRFAESVDSGMLVMGAYGRGFISRLFRKSAAEKIIATGTVPVFIAHR